MRFPKSLRPALSVRVIGASILIIVAASAFVIWYLSRYSLQVTRQSSGAVEIADATKAATSIDQMLYDRSVDIQIQARQLQFASFLTQSGLRTPASRKHWVCSYPMSPPP